MKTEKIHIQHEENKQWLNNLHFYQDEVMLMKNCLEEIASRNSSRELLIQIEQFQNQLDIQANQIDALKQEIKLDNDCIHKEIQGNEVRVDDRLIKDHYSIRIRMEVFERIFSSIRRDLNQFLKKII